MGGSLNVLIRIHLIHISIHFRIELLLISFIEFATAIFFLHIACN